MRSATLVYKLKLNGPCFSCGFVNELLAAFDCKTSSSSRNVPYMTQSNIVTADTLYTTLPCLTLHSFCIASYTPSFLIVYSFSCKGLATSSYRIAVSSLGPVTLVLQDSFAIVWDWGRFYPTCLGERKDTRHFLCIQTLTERILIGNVSAITFKSNEKSFSFSRDC